MAHDKEILDVDVLDDLLGLDDIYTCMIAKKNLEGVLIIPDTFKSEIALVWRILESVLNDELEIVAKYHSYNLNCLFVSMQDHNIFFQVIPNTDTAVIIFSNKKNTEKVLDNIRSILNDLKKTSSDIQAMEE